MKKQHYKDQWFILPVIGIKKNTLWAEKENQYNLCLAWWDFGIDIKICRKKWRVKA